MAFLLFPQFLRDIVIQLKYKIDEISPKTQRREDRQPDHHDRHSTHQHILHAELHEDERSSTNSKTVQT